jgi:hypothetical protein
MPSALENLEPNDSRWGATLSASRRVSLRLYETNVCTWLSRGEPRTSISKKLPKSYVIIDAAHLLLRATSGFP